MFSIRGVISPGKGVSCCILLSWDMHYSESKHEGFQLEVQESGIFDILQVLVRAKDSNERFVVNGEDKVVQSKNKELTLL